MKRELQGRYVTISTAGEKARAFVPAPLPPRPPIDWTPALRSKFDQAWLSLGRLDSVSTLLPDTSLFLSMYVRKEAVLSSMIEGTQSSLSAQYEALKAVNRELVGLYWDIGRLIVERKEAQGWGKAVVEQLAADLRTSFPAWAAFRPPTSGG